MDSNVQECKRIHIKWQVLSEAEDRTNEQFLIDIEEWLRLEGVAPTTLKVVLDNIRLQFKALSQSRRAVKELMEENLRLALKKKN